MTQAHRPDDDVRLVPGELCQWYPTCLDWAEGLRDNVPVCAEHRSSNGQGNYRPSTRPPYHNPTLVPIPLENRFL